MIMQTWLFLLLPVAALSGWLMARRHYKRRYRQQENAFSPAYFKGLNYLLNEQPDKAIDVFIGLLEVNSETVETHLALANLFRRRGETERAIRIHQNLIARPSLHGEQRTQAMIELGLDYMHAGVLDRAEHLFLELMQLPVSPPEAARQLLRIYQQEKKWRQAIDMASRLDKNQQDNTQPLIAQFYCELAEQSVKQDKHECLNLVRLALFHDTQCVRASLIEARVQLSLGQPQKALKTLKNIERQNSQFLPEALPLLYQAFQQTANLQGYRVWLQQILHKNPNLTSVRLMLTRLIDEIEGRSAARQYLYDALHRHPSVEGLNTLINLGEHNQESLVPLIQQVTNAMVLRGDRYSCKNCGFSGKTLHWLCPSCNRWATMRPTEIHLSALEKLLEKTA
ncbi:Heat shock (predicted periplasmic) protein YciM, precursor [Methylophaga frappieri]|uniref:Lipopolysaccharide assembly protein B n=1 Tax=Methylophaga frappieri (strain ATCC BAA-2434 / DSM 25690 / JAM7) TaxID=754477 RepID=I1YFU2_METFJ|nr:lipopolysaccharide assembly protein LapB [Methylophaga frappieri]AFJ01785.1 Heat shock (predicted periplasmic) protein YciM, precursor [Methylophaga frappieri]